MLTGKTNQKPKPHTFNGMILAEMTGVWQALFSLWRQNHSRDSSPTAHASAFFLPLSSVVQDQLGTSGAKHKTPCRSPVFSKCKTSTFQNSGSWNCSCWTLLGVDIFHSTWLSKKLLKIYRLPQSMQFVKMDMNKSQQARWECIQVGCPRPEQRNWSPKTTSRAGLGNKNWNRTAQTLLIRCF